MYEVEKTDAVRQQWDKLRSENCNILKWIWNVRTKLEEGIQAYQWQCAACTTYPQPDSNQKMTGSPSIIHFAPLICYSILAKLGHGPVSKKDDDDPNFLTKTGPWKPKPILRETWGSLASDSCFGRDWKKRVERHQANPYWITEIIGLRVHRSSSSGLEVQWFHWWCVT